VYSDGVVECTNPSMEQFGVDRLVKGIEATRHADLRNTVAAIDEDLLIWRGNQDFEDDVCLLAVEVE
jgi:phosphoserine phosphatase RsbU/P